MDDGVPFTSDTTDINLPARVRFRVLIVGRANAGKTTILERLCNESVDNAKVYRDGKPTGVKMKKGEPGRGEHLITDEIIFPSHPGFVFHDSCGFESGSDQETLAVASFIRQRAESAKEWKSLIKAKETTDVLNAIWVCIPLDNDRPLQDAELAVFKSNPGKVPVLVIFTKRDARSIKEFSNAKRRDPSLDATRTSRILARQQADKTVDFFVESLQVRLKEQPYPPADFIVTKNMNEMNKASRTYCDGLIELTMGKLFDVHLETLLVTVRHNNVRERTEYAFRWLLRYIVWKRTGSTSTLEIPRMLWVISFFLPMLMDRDYYRYLLDDRRRDYYYLLDDRLLRDDDNPPPLPPVYHSLASVFQPFTMPLEKENLLPLLSSCTVSIMIVQKIILGRSLSTEVEGRAAQLVQSLSSAGRKAIEEAIQVKCSYRQLYLVKFPGRDWDQTVGQTAKELVEIVEDSHLRPFE